jgi:hypothetical protein
MAKFTVVFEVLDDDAISSLSDFSLWLNVSVGKSIFCKVEDIYPDDVTANDYELDRRDNNG